MNHGHPPHLGVAGRIITAGGRLIRTAAEDAHARRVWVEHNSLTPEHRARLQAATEGRTHTVCTADYHEIDASPAWKLGREAIGWRADRFRHNPYPPNSDDHLDWLRGLRGEEPLFRLRQRRVP